MVRDSGAPTDLESLLQGNPEKVTRYLLSSGRMAMILLDRKGVILDCNAFFLESVGLSEKPVGKSIQAFLREGLQAGWECIRGDCRPVKLTFTLNGPLEYFLSGHILNVQEHYLLFAHTVRLTDHEMVVKLSRLTDELTDLTRQLNKKNRELEAANETITRLMNTDPLTGLTNRRQLKERMDAELSKARRHGHPLSALMTDIDHFKSINDTYGHAAGDAVLVGVASILRQTCRKEDIVARYGGEEFVVLLPDSPAAAALDCAERIRKAIEGNVFPEIDRKVTVSLGATLFAPTDTEDSFIGRADAALYEAKTSGRNRVVLK
ncbi:MAG: GGDEF domain-containing protein [Smithellaceae bacterium]|jgi:two-component system, cell cycle response regulator|nr:GGDEF domain-containing protein [Smithellaceae bacterium]MDD3260234.1 GGDEF domain-containing protein [Smithellaceae bacterium]MDD3849862.1 GGDEF domain-containing protein [Smithellaceae bacterium]HOG12797.1 GGDEF domain-containing protein [Smithellaceae bacterium]HOQ72139.1 GGDEF domain-containing protein [Smithellaceae bacterium]